MGLWGLPVYGNIDLGAAIQTAEDVIAKVKTNKFDKDDLVELEKALTEIRNAITDEA
jgi:hypothetical protein